MIKKTFLLFVTSTFLFACGGSGNDITHVKSMQRKDKKLSCREILLEMNEADFYRKAAHKNKGPKLKNMLMPLGYVSTYMEAGEAIDAAEARVAYLDRIYEIMNCDQKEEEAEEVPLYREIPHSYNRQGQEQNIYVQEQEFGMRPEKESYKTSDNRYYNEEEYIRTGQKQNPYEIKQNVNDYNGSVRKYFLDHSE